MYCPHCGHETEREITPEEKALHEAVEIERIRADKEIAIARLQSRMAREELDTTEHVAEVEAEAEVISSVAGAEIIAAGVEPDPEPMPEPAPVVMTEPEPEPEMPERGEHPEPPRPKKSSSNYFGF